MPIDWDAETHEFHLHSEQLSYVVCVLENGALGQLHVGAPLTTGRSYRHLAPGEFRGFDNRLGEPVAMEYPTEGTGDYRVPAIAVTLANGSSALSLAYVRYRIKAGKPLIPGLPSTYAESDSEADTLEVTLADPAAGVEVDIRYSVFTGRPIIARSAVIRNTGAGPIELRCAMSASLDLPDADWDLMQLSGTWARERSVVERRLAPGHVAIGSLGGASGHEHNPFLALKRPPTTEDHGEVIGLSLVYSGNFLAEAEVDPYGTARVRLGINPEGFRWHLEPGAAFATPEVILCWSAEGLGRLSDAYHSLYRERLARGAWRDRPRPVLLNSWEGAYFDFDEERLVTMASSARELGVELFVLDDGWFGSRDDDTTSLGDWFVDRRKLPNGLDGLARRIDDLDMGFGLWIEPEMVSEQSRLFAEHPDWAIGIPGRHRTVSRNQYVLDMSRQEIVDYLFAELSDVLTGAPFSYVKWDMNRNVTEPYGLALPADRQGEFFHRYIVGVYALYERLTAAFPNILFESCAGGGGRFDPGMLAWAPQGWTSDDTDAVERLRIQWATSMVYPLSSMGAHVSAVPNHQIGRITPLATRAAVAFFGVFGYELDPTTLSADERRQVSQQIAFYVERRELFQRGRFIRLRSPFDGDGNETAWMVVSEDRSRAVVGHYRVLNRPVPGPNRLRLRGLDPSLRYRVSSWPNTADAIERVNRAVRGGDDLMTVGLFVESPNPRDAQVRGDFEARLFDVSAEPA